MRRANIGWEEMCSGLSRGAERSGVGWSGVEWVGVAWSGLEWRGEENREEGSLNTVVHNDSSNDWHNLTVD